MEKAYKYGFFIVLGCLAFLIIFTPIKKPDVSGYLKQQVYDSLAIEEKNKVIEEKDQEINLLKGEKKKQAKIIKELKKEMVENEKEHLQEIENIQVYSITQLDSIKYQYIEQGTDSSETVEIVEIFKERDFYLDQWESCIGICEAQEETINIQEKELSVWEEKEEAWEEKEELMNSSLERKDEEIKQSEKDYTKKIRKTKWLAGGVVGVVILTAVLLN